MERENTSTRVKEAMKFLSDNHKLRTRPPFAWKFVGKGKDYAPVPEQQIVIAKIKHMYANGYKLSQIAKYLNSIGDNMFLPKNRGEDPPQIPTVFYPQTIKRILVDHGLIQDSTGKRIPIEERIKTHHVRHVKKCQVQIEPPSFPQSILEIKPHDSHQ
jgi:hypothetical protein